MDKIEAEVLAIGGGQTGLVVSVSSPVKISDFRWVSSVDVVNQDGETLVSGTVPVADRGRAGKTTSLRNLTGESPIPSHEAEVCILHAVNKCLSDWSGRIKKAVADRNRAEFFRRKHELDRRKADELMKSSDEALRAAESYESASDWIKGREMDWR